MTNSIIPFNFEDNNVRVLDRDGKPWFVLTDVCGALGIGNSRMAADRLDEDEKLTLTLSEGHVDQGLSSNSPGTKLTIVNESGLYRLVMRSDKPEAKRFQKWVTGEVLPTLRKTGGVLAGVAPDIAADPRVLHLMELARMQADMIRVERQQAVIAAEAARAVAIAEAAEAAEAEAQATAMSCMDFSVMAYANLKGIPIDLSTAQRLGKVSATLSRQRKLPSARRAIATFPSGQHLYRGCA